MNKCPSCNETPISLGGWCSSVNSIKCTCKRCGAQLQANMKTWLVFITIVLAMIATATISITQFSVDFKNDRLLLIGLIFIPVVIGSLFGYFLGGYKAKKIAQK